MSSLSASRPTTSMGKQYHIDCAEGDLFRYILTPGDPDRVIRIATKLFDKPGWYPQFFEHFYDLPFWPFRPYEIKSTKRGNRVLNGHYSDAPISEAATGMGPSSAGIIITELLGVGCDRFIRVGTCGSIREQIHVGDIVIINEGIRKYDGFTYMYAKPKFRAMADSVLTDLLIESGQELGYGLGQNLHVGSACTTSDFYLGQGRSWIEERMTRYMIRNMRERYKEVMKNTDALIFEMEASVLLTLASLSGAKAGGLCLVVADRVRDEFATTEQIHGGEYAIGRIACEAMKKMYEIDLRNS